MLDFINTNNLIQSCTVCVGQSQQSQLFLIHLCYVFDVLPHWTLSPLAHDICRWTSCWRHEPRPGMDEEQKGGLFSLTTVFNKKPRFLTVQVCVCVFKTGLQPAMLPQAG